MLTFTGCGRWFKSFESGKVGVDIQCGYQYRRNTKRHLCPECLEVQKKSGGKGVRNEKRL